MSKLLVRACALLVLSLGSLLPFVAATTAEAGGSHPYFDDRGTLTWYHSLAEAGAAARSQGKVIFVEYGRRRCGSCRIVVSNVLPDPLVRNRIRQVAVGLVSNCDRPEPQVDAVLRRHLPNARMLPFCAFLTPEGQWITGFAGGSSPQAMLMHVRRAEAWRPQVARRAPPAPQPVLRPCPAPPPESPCVAPRAAPTPAPTPAPAPAPAGVTPPAPRRTPEPVRTPEPARAPVASRYPAPDLSGTPDSADVAGLPLPKLPASEGDCAPPTVRRPAGPLPPPRVIVNPPVRVSRGAARTVATTPKPTRRPARPTSRAGASVASTRRQAEAAAGRGAWSEVLRLTGDAPTDPALRTLNTRAHAWAHGRLDRAVAAIEEGRFEAALEEVKAVLEAMPGQPESIDAQRGLGALQTLLELQYLNPDGQVAKVVKQNAFDELRGTRWASLFRS